jgi:hypothetical protein
MQSAEGFSPPYGPPANVLAIIEKWRDHSIPEQITTEWMEKIGLSPNLAPLNIRALRFLGLVDDGGFPTDVARRLRTAATSEYHAVLSEIVEDAYQPILSILNPKEASRTQVDDAFRHVKPEAQRARMVAFFLGMCRAAGMTLKEEPKGGRPPKVGGPIRVRRQPQNLPKQQNEPVRLQPQLALPPGKPLDPALLGIVQKITDLETKDDLEAWIAMFKAAFSFVKKLP